MPRYWQKIDNASTTDPLLLGGKGSNLVKLARAGFPVPEGVVITTTAFSRFKSSPQALDKLVAEAVRSFPASWKWAVRSSAADEDGAGTSFAGQHDTFLNVSGASGISQAVRDCWASLQNEGAAAYRQKLASSRDAAMAVVVQRMADARCAGVLFTRHPVRPDVDRVVVEGVPGLGESLVSGREHPDRIELTRQGKRTLSEDNTGKACLDQVGDNRFADLACRVEQVFGCPQDVEWAYDGSSVWLLQTRPITTLTRPSEVWTRTWGDEFWAEATTPFQFTCLGRWIKEDYLDALEEINGWDFLGHMDQLARIHSHVYFNAGWQFKLLHLLHPSFRMERFFNWLPPYWLAELPTLPYPRVEIMMCLVRCRMADKNANILAHYKRLPAYVRKVEKTLAAGLADDLTRLSDQELWARFERNDRMGREHFRFIRWGLGSFLVPLRLTCAKISEKWANDATDETLNLLLTDPGGNRTMEVNEALKALGHEAARLPEVLTYLTSPEAPPTLAGLEAIPGAFAFAQKFQDFFKAHGHRGTTRELHMPRWMDDPSLVLGMAGAFAASAQAPEQAAPGGGRNEKDIEKQWLAAIKKQPAGRIKALIASRILKLARSYTQYRENQRYALDFILTDMRHVVLEISRRLVVKGRLKNEELVFFLTDQEFRGLWSGTASAPPDLEDRKKEFEEDSRRLPPDWIIDGVPYGGESAQATGQDGLSGVAASSGVARGPARVVMGAHELSLVRRGDILVAPNTDSGWTPVFALVSGLVVQTGGVLSHAAIVAREYRIPAVTGLAGACSRITSGEIIEVNGNTGQVTRIPTD